MIIVFGAMATGKTEYAKKLADKLDYRYMSFDKLFNEFRGNSDALIRGLLSEDTKVVIDGWFSWEESEVKSVKKLEGMDVKWVHVFCPKWMAVGRLNRKEPDVRGSIDISFQRTTPGHTFKFGEPGCRFVDSTDFEFEDCTYGEYLRRTAHAPASAESVKAFLKELETHEKYQNIQLPFGLSTNGYTDCERSWMQIKPLLEWKGKAVLDVGCHWGYFCFEMQKMGAWVTGIDVSKEALGVARRIRDMKEANVTFQRRDIELDDIGEYDVILLLNTLHHLRGPFHVLRKIFSRAKTVILEVELPRSCLLAGMPVVEMGEPIKLSSGRTGGHLRFSKIMLMRFASECGHFLKAEVPSYRPHRTILMFQRD